MKIPKSLLCLPLALINSISLGQEPTFAVAAGLITPRDDTGMYLRTDNGQIEVEWTAETKVALEVDTKQLANIDPGKLRYHVPESEEVIEFPLPSGPTSAMLIPPPARWTALLGEFDAVKKLPLGGMRFYFGVDPIGGQAASVKDKRFIGEWSPNTPYDQMTVKGKVIQLTSHKDEIDYVLVFGDFTTADCHPFIYRATVLGTKVGEVITAQEIYLRPLGDQVGNDDPTLPRYLYMGDSISGNYSASLKAALKGQLNAHHPPANCGASQRGRERIHEWLGAYEQPGHQWDVISFNHGHWDAAESKQDYQANLEAIIASLKPTGAKLVWVTTCPVPLGRGAIGDSPPGGHASNSKSGVIAKFFNPWAAEVMAGHPEISICDHWQLVKDNPQGAFTEWWQGDDLHFDDEMSAVLGNYLARHIQGVISAP